ncbi:hypothetical protein [Actinomycetospora corticicola]|uniref:ANTAR domain-containing protein n=1 Tax=Actinomycetospora corticicola TaxID=663602 RepID=A0A7Y9DRW4_9PSEU|nr:hypothetical protein [Actinomycetospora corticicola]NYD34355.1 hypothetical protein [Actinomycetospora corticicola]
MLEFLDRPQTEPSPEWIAAATDRDGPQSQSDRAEQVLAVRREAENTERRLASLRARPDASRDDEVVGILAAAFNVSRARAFECLLWISQQTGTPVPTVADQFMARVEVLGTNAHDREALLGLLSKLAGPVNTSAR